MSDKIQHKSDFKKLNCCVIIPTYNNEQTIVSVIEDVLSFCDDVYVVNDGSTDQTNELLKPFKDKVTLIEYTANQGKGNAILLGFNEAYKDGFSYAITIDSDGQHYASDLPIFLKELQHEKNTVLIGSRSLNPELMSKGSSFANKFSNFWFLVETGVKLEDTQSGYRLYPLEPASKLKFFSKKYEFEIENIVRLSWKGCKVKNIPINVFYPKKEERISHFRPFYDFFRISILNFILVTLALVYFLPRSFGKMYKSKGFKRVLKEDIFQVGAPAHITATSIGFGVFMGIFPIWGYQLIVGFIIAHLLKLNKAIFFIFANISIPPMIPLILYLSYVLGSYIMGHGEWLISIDEIGFETIKTNILQYLIGSVALATIAGTAIGFISYGIIKLTGRKNSK